MITDPLPFAGARRRQSRRGRQIVAMTAVLVALAGCSTSRQPDIVGSVPDDYRVSHPIAIEEQLFTMDVPVGLDSAYLSTGIKGNVVGFAQRFNDSGSALMAIVAPAGSPNEDAATGISHEIYLVLLDAGVRPSAIDFRSYHAGSGEANAPVRLAFNKVAAHVDGCGAWPDHLDNDFRNRNYKNFGCATQANLAMMVENPLDLLYPRGETPADALRRSTVLDKYGKGEVYSAKQKLEAGQIAQGVGN